MISTQHKNTLLAACGLGLMMLLLLSCSPALAKKEQVMQNDPPLAMHATPHSRAFAPPPPLHTPPHSTAHRALLGCNHPTMPVWRHLRAWTLLLRPPTRVTC